MHAYERQDTTQTLAEGVAEYYERNPTLADVRDMSPEAQEFFRCHDVAHVVFGCNTSLPHEATVKLCSVFGTTAGFAVLRGYRLHESVDIYRTLGVASIAATVLESVIIVPRTVVRCLRQRKRWPWDGFSDHRDVPLGRLRAEFGIVVAGGRGSRRRRGR